MNANAQNSLIEKDPANPTGTGPLDIPEEDLVKVRSLNRFLGKLLEESWREICANLGGDRTALEYSGILPLRHPGLLPFMDQPGVFILLGPAPSLSVLNIGYSQAPLGGALSSKVAYFMDLNGGRRIRESTISTPMFAACISMEEEWTMVRPFWALLNRRI